MTVRSPYDFTHRASHGRAWTRGTQASGFSARSSRGQAGQPPAAMLVLRTAQERRQSAWANRWPLKWSVDD
jgi:hypothetical protein